MSEKSNKFILGFCLMISYAFQATAMSPAAAANKHIKISADSSLFSIKKNQIIYQGHAILTQGKSRITAQMITFNLNKKQNDIEKLIARGNPAYYSQHKGPRGKWINSEANIIVFWPNKHKVLLQDNAKITQNNTIFSAPVIYYNSKTQDIRSNPNNKQATSNLIINPKEKT